MALQFIMGGSGSGKSTCLYRMISREALEHREKNYIVLVPDQFTLETQKTLVKESGCGGILNIDVLSFHRLAYRVLEEMPALRKTVLEDTGKMMLLRKVFTEQKGKLTYFKRGLYKPGFLDECKSFLCELMQYAVTTEDLKAMEEKAGKDSLTAFKLRDLQLIYQSFSEKLGDTYMTAEELVPQLTKVVSSVKLLQNSVICLDGFTGFTPTQYDLLRELLCCCERMYVTVTTDRTGMRRQVFSLSTDTITKLSRIAAEAGVPIEEPIVTGKGKKKVPYRLCGSEELTCLEERLFTYGKNSTWESVQEKTCRDVEVTVCRKESEEAEYVARRIWWLVEEQGYSFDDIAVLTGDIAAYEQLLGRAFERLGIRYFMDYKRSIGANAMAEYIMSFLEMVRRGMDYESTFRFLRGGLSPLTREETDLLENYVIAQGKRGLPAYLTPWEYKAGNMDLLLVNEYRLRFVDSIAESVQQLQGGKKTVEEFTRILYRLVIKNELYEKVMEKSRCFEEHGEKILAKEYKSIYRLMMNLFDEMVELLGAEQVTFREYTEILSAGISEGLVGFVPPTSDQVMVGDVTRSRLKDVKVLFFMGVNDDRIPPAQGSPGLLSESERRNLHEAGLELAPLPEKQAFTEQFYLYLALTKPSDKLILTYAKMGEDGSGKRPAYLIGRIRSIFPKLVITEEEREQSAKKKLGTDCGRTYMISQLADGTFSSDAGWWEIAGYYRKREPKLLPHLLQVRKSGKGNTKISRKAAQMLYGEEIYGSVTRLEQFARCPYAHFILFGLGLREREQYLVESFDYGNIFHNAMEYFSHILEEKKKSWQDLTEEEVRHLASDCIEHAAERYKGRMFYQSKRVEFMITRMKHVLQNTVWGIWKQMAAGEFCQMYSEKQISAKDGLDALRISLDDGKSMSFLGKIDRIDICEDGGERLIKIVDYKSGTNDLSLSQVYYGLQLQLVLYMAAAMEWEAKQYPEKKPVPAAMLYYQMKESDIPWKKESVEGRRERALGELRCRGYVNEDAAILEKIDGNMAYEGTLKPGTVSQIVPVGVTGKGMYTAASHILSTENFSRLTEHAQNLMRDFGSRIYAGEIHAMPFVMELRTGCDYCELRAICGIEKKQLASAARKCPVMKDEEVWEVLNGHSVDGGSEEDHRDEE